MKLPNRSCFCWCESEFDVVLEQCQVDWKVPMISCVFYAHELLKGINQQAWKDSSPKIVVLNDLIEKFM